MVEEISLNEMKTNSSEQNQEKKPTEDVKKDMYKIITELKQKMQEIDVITRELEEKRRELDKNNPTKTKKLLEEIKVPSLEILR